MKKKLLTTAGIILFAIGLLTCAIVAGNSNTALNGFNRRFVKFPVSTISNIENKSSLREIAGATNAHIYFADLVPGNIEAYSLNLNQKYQYHLPVPADPNLIPLFYTSIDSPYVHILAGNIPAVIQSDLNTKHTQVTYTNTGTFGNGISLSNDDFIFKCFDTSIKDALFVKISLSTKKSQIENGLSELVHDGCFQYDGILNYDPVSHLLAYVCAYCNHVTCFDTCMNLVYRSKTIDTFHTSTVRSKLMGKGGSRYFTMSKPPRYVNKSTCAYNGLLFVNSALKSDNERQKAFRKNFVIDVYDLRNGSYKGSFYIPSFNDKLSTFKILNDNLFVALYHKHIATYRIDLKQL